MAGMVVLQRVGKPYEACSKLVSYSVLDLLSSIVLGKKERISMYHEQVPCPKSTYTSVLGREDINEYPTFFLSDCKGRPGLRFISRSETLEI